MSEGTDRLTFRNAQTFNIERSVHVNDDNKPQLFLNELEYAKGLVWANIYQSSEIVAINPQHGRIIYRADLKALTDKHTDRSLNRVLNGIAYVKDLDAFWPVPLNHRTWPPIYSE